MSNPENLEELIDRIIDLKSFDNEQVTRIKIKAPKNETDRIRSGLDELKIMKIDTKKIRRRNSIGIIESKGKGKNNKI